MQWLKALRSVADAIVQKTLSWIFTYAKANGEANVRLAQSKRMFAIKSELKPGNIVMLIAMKNALIWSSTILKTKISLRHTERSLKKSIPSIIRNTQEKERTIKMKKPTAATKLVGFKSIINLHNT